MRAAFAVMLCALMLNGVFLILPSEAEAFPDTAWIAGTMTDGTGPVPNVYVKAMLFMADMEEVNYSFTDAEGNYSMGVPGGLEFMVLAGDGSHYMAMETTSVLPGQTKYINFTLESIAPVLTNVTIKGRVLNETGTPVTTGHVVGYSRDPLGADMPNFVNLTTPDVAGYFELNVIESPTGGGVISFDFPGFPPSENMTETPIVGGMTYWFNLTLTPKVYNDDAFIYGYVTDIDTGESLSSVVVSIENENPFSGGNRYSNYTLTNETGYYEMNVQNGSGSLTLRKTGYSMKQFRLDISEGASVQQDAQLRLCEAIVRGNVTDLVSGAPIAFARVFLFDNPLDPWSGNISMAVTNNTGYYELATFTGTDLVLGSEQDGYSQEFVTVNISVGDELWQDFGLWPANAYIEGYVTDAATGMPVAGEVWIHLYSDKYEEWVRADGSGYYNSSVVPGDYVIEATAMDHWPYHGNAVATEGNTTVHDIVMMPWLSSELVGTVTDLFTGLPIPSVSIWIGSPYYGGATTTNVTGEYNFKVVASVYQVYANVPGYFDYRGEVSVDNLTTVVYDFALTPRSPPTDTWLHGYVLDVDTLAPLNASVRINLPDHTYRNETRTDGTGWYEMYVPSWELEVTVQANGHYPVFQTINVTGLIDYSLNVNLTTDPWGPNLTYNQAPTENISAVNPSITDITVEDDNFNSMYLFLLMHWNTTLGGFNYTVIMFNATSVDPLDTWDTLGVTRVGDNYTVHMEWPAMIPGGWLENTIDRAYLPSSTTWDGPEQYYSLRGEYSNGTVTDTMGSALFNMTTGAFVMFRPDGGPTILAPDPTGIFEPFGMVAEFLNDDLWPTRLEQRSLDGWGVADLTFSFDSLVPSEMYKSMFWTADWGSRGATSMVNLTVDNDPPVADAGPDLSGVENTTFELNASMSSDNIGITSYVWEFTDGYGLPVVLTTSVPVLNHVFNMTGVFNVTLKVRDAAGHEVADSMVVTVLQDMPPTADAGSDQTMNEDTVVQFDGSGSADDLGIVNLTWEIVELSILMYESMPSHTFDMPGIYNVTLTVTDTIGQTGVDQIVITIVDVTNPVAGAGADDTVTVGTPYALNGTSSIDNVGIVNYTWTFTDVTAQTLYGVEPVYNFARLGVFTITLTVADAEGLTDTDIVVITVIDDVPPVANAGSDRSIRVGTSTSLDGALSTDNVGITSYTWTFLDLTLQTLTGVSQSYTFAHTGLFNVTLNVTDASGNYAVDWVEVTVYDDLAPIANAGTDQTVNIGSVVALNGSLSTDNYGIVNYSWTFVDVTQRTLWEATSSYQFDHAGVFNVTLNVTDAAGNYAVDWVEITVIDNIPPVAQATVSQASIATGVEVTFISTGSSDNVGIVNYTWTLMDGTVQTRYGPTATYTFNNAGMFTVTLTVRDAAGLSDSDTANVAVELSNEGPTANAGPDQTVRVGEQVEFDGSGSDDDAGTSGLNYTWVFVYEGRTETLYGVSPTFDFEVAGTYTVTLTVEDEGELSDTDTVSIVVEEAAESFVEQYWWLLAVIVAVVVLVGAFFMMKKRRGPGLEEPEPGPPEPTEEPAPPEDNEL